MRRLAGTVILVGPIVGGLAALVVIAARDPVPRILLALICLGAGFLLWRLLNHPGVRSRRLPGWVGIAAMAVATFLVFAFARAPDVAWLVVIALVIGLMSPTVGRVLHEEWG